MLGKSENQIPYVIYFISQNISHVELNYTIMEKELQIYALYY